MNIQILCVGKVKDSFNQDQINSLCKEINKSRHSIEIVEYPDLKIPEKIAKTEYQPFLERECEKMIDKISHDDFVIALCIEGKELTTDQHMMYFKKAIEEEYRNIYYLIGGSLGLPDKLKKRANLKISFSKMTFPHQLMRAVLCEEIKNVATRV